MSMNPRETTEKIRNDYRDYIASILSVKDQEISNLAFETAKETEFVKGPYLETTLPFVDGHSLKELADSGLVSKEFGRMGDAVHYSDWKLRIHQESALKHIIEDKRNMVVSTGTGSGKTECYLYPIFNELMRQKEAGTLDAGVRALLIFPMNALANDQQKKLRKLLKSYPDITFGRYTGETLHKKGNETAEEAEERMHREYDNDHVADTEEAYRKSIPNELMCREMMAKTPPHILLTNYAMLEYMLLRPDTAPFFDNSSAKNWRFIVIDEAHTYKGANGTEIAYLLRRVKERIRHNMEGDFRCIATSATLGSEDGKAGLALFAQHLFGEPFDASDIITTKRLKRCAASDSKLLMPDDYTRLKKETEGMSEEDKGKYLYDTLSKDLRLFRVYDALNSKPKRIEDVADYVFDDFSLKKGEEALIDLIELAASARKSMNDSALLPARYHLFVKSLEGMFVRLYPTKKVFFDRKEKDVVDFRSYSVFELANCQKCAKEYLIGKTIESDQKSYFVQTSSMEKPEYYFVDNGEDSVDFTGADEDDRLEGNYKINELKKYHMCLSCGRITHFESKHPLDCCAVKDDKKIVTVYNLKYSGKDNESNCCPCCGATKRGLIKRFLTANQPATFAVAKSLYDAIPPRPFASPDKKDKTKDFFDDIFADDSLSDDDFLSPELKDESGRKLLIFSDNRQEAAYFAGFFEKKYNLIMWRKIILKCLKSAEGHTLNMCDLITRVFHEADKMGLYSFDQERRDKLTDDKKREIASHYVMQEFVSPDIQTGLEGMGYIQIMPEYVKLNDSVEAIGLRGDDLWNLLRFMMDTVRQKGATSFPDNIRATDEFFEPRNHTGYFRQSLTENTYSGDHYYGFIPEKGSVNRRYALVHKVLFGNLEKSEEKDKITREELINIFNLICKFVKTKHIIVSSDKNTGSSYQINYAKWNVHYVADEDTLYRCNKCGKVFGYSIKGICPEMKCNGKLSPFKASEIKSDPYYNALFSDSKIIPMLSREHTAQLSSSTAGEYQKDFEEGKINVLSCSTTFEMGVDVGELEATFLRNVPPETANYIQRAGRAGRRTSSAAFSVTFARRNSHDMTFYNNPAQIIAGKIAPPILEIYNDKIAERHLNSIVVAWFFKKHPEFFDEKTKRIVSYNEPNNMQTELKKELESHPQDLLESIHKVFPKEVCDMLHVDDWSYIDNIVGEEGILTRAILERNADIAGLKQFSRDVRQQYDEKKSSVGTLKRAIHAEKLINTLEDEQSISFLSAKGVLPKYGFPIDSVSLDILGGHDDESDKIDLSRDLKMAIREFAPPAKVVANGKIWESYAINTVPDKGWPSYVYYECPKCKLIIPPDGNMVDITTKLDKVPSKKCTVCKTLLNPKLFIIPLFGFSTKYGYKPKTVGDSRPKAFYNTQTQFWGIEGLTEKQKAEAKDRSISMKGKEVGITYSPGGKLFVLNQGNGRGFSICPSCGYAEDPMNMRASKKHDSKFDKPCRNAFMPCVSLGHVFSTDIMKIRLPLHSPSNDYLNSAEHKDQTLSILYAILEGASQALDISRDDISGCVIDTQEFVLFDDTSGGSGYVKHIFENFEKVIREARNKVAGSCGCTPETSCYGCLRNYSNQFYHDQISRGMAYDYLSWLIDTEVSAQADTGNRRNSKKETSNGKNSEKETVGTKKLEFDYSSSIGLPDMVTQLEAMRESSSDDDIVEGYSKLIDAVAGNNYERPISEESLPAKECDIWPELFWPKSHVALFAPESKKQFDILKKYNWYCYIVDHNINAEVVLSHIREE